MRIVIVNTHDYLLDNDFIDEAISQAQGRETILLLTGSVDRAVISLLDNYLFFKVYHLKGGKLTKNEAEFIATYISLSQGYFKFNLVIDSDGINEAYTSQHINSMFGGYWRVFNQSFEKDNLNYNVRNLEQIVSSLSFLPSKFIGSLRESFLLIVDVMSLYHKLYFEHNEIATVEECSNNSFQFNLTKPNDLKWDIINFRKKVVEHPINDVLSDNLRDFFHVIDSVCIQKEHLEEGNSSDSLLLTFLFYSEYFLSKANTYRRSSREAEAFQYIVRSFECEAIVELLYREIGYFNRNNKRYVIGNTNLSGAGAYIQHLGLDSETEAKLRKLLDVRNISVLGHGFVSILPDMYSDFVSLLRAINYHYKDSTPLISAKAQFFSGIQPIKMESFKRYILEQGIDLTILK